MGGPFNIVILGKTFIKNSNKSGGEAIVEGGETPSYNSLIKFSPYVVSANYLIYYDPKNALNKQSLTCSNPSKNTWLHLGSYPYSIIASIASLFVIPWPVVLCTRIKSSFLGFSEYQ